MPLLGEVMVTFWSSAYYYVTETLMMMLKVLMMMHWMMMVTLPSLFPFFHTPATSPPSASLSRPFPCHLQLQNKFKMLTC